MIKFYLIIVNILAAYFNGNNQSLFKSFIPLIPFVEFPELPADQRKPW